MLFISNKYFLRKDSVNTSRWVFSAFVCKRDDRKKRPGGEGFIACHAIPGRPVVVGGHGAPTGFTSYQNDLRRRRLTVWASKCGAVERS
ncbi:hypothetical protein SAMN05216286_0472 [Kosakonia oryzae]|uniref:Uncharacterized protein n=1 Tax=Kosakonia oryzae TaxID=497725 RepID=A0AA94KN91_9ENTR|nr:hypothetical protein SAMN05216286_0472 [Kosakonia oryzae]